MIFKTIKNFNLQRNKLIFIGDDIRDWITAKNAKCHYIHKPNKIFTKNKLYLGNLVKSKNIINVIKDFYLV